MIACLVVMRASAAEPATRPQPSGKLVDLGGHKLHVNCTGKGSPTVVVENGLGDFSFDWILVQAKSPFLLGSVPTIVPDTPGAIPGRSRARLLRSILSCETPSRSSEKRAHSFWWGTLMA